MNTVVIKEKLKNMYIEYSHPSYSLELKLVSELKLCLKEEAMNTLDRINDLEQPVYSSNPIRSKKISLVAWCSVFTKAALDTNINSNEIYNLKDFFIAYIDNIKDKEELNTFEYTMLSEYIDYIRIRRASSYQYPISKVVQYIYDHRSEKLTVNNISEKFKLSSDYLSKCFKDEVGVSISPFIKSTKLNIAKSYLRSSQMSTSDIVDKLNYCSASYFANLFKKETGMSPSEYRRLHIF